MKIVHITFGFKLGGLETMLVNIANEQVKSHNVSLLLINNLVDEALLAKLSPKIKVLNCRRTAKSRSLIPVIRLNAYLLRLHPDVIHVHAPKVVSLLLPFFMKKVVYTIHDVTIGKQYLKQYKHSYSIAECVRKDMLERTGIDAPVVYNGIKVDSIKTKSKYMVGNPFRIVQISRLDHKKKGQDILIKAIDLIHKRGVADISLDIIGEGNSYDFLQELIHSLNLDNIVNLCGTREYSWIQEHLRDYDLLVQPSVFEGFGLTVAEGMAAKIPVLVSDIDGPMEIIDNGKYGYYFKKGDIEDCANMIYKVMNTDNADLVQKAWQHVNENFSIARTANSYIEKYRELLK